MASINSLSYIRSRQRKIEISCKYDTPEDNSSFNDTVCVPPVIQSAETIVLMGKKGCSALIIKCLFKYKEFFKRLPVIGKILIAGKNRIHNFNKDAVDFSEILPKPFFRFVNELYVVALGRSLERNDIYSYASLYMNGLAKEGIIYLVCSSREFNNRKNVINIKKYKRAFKKYRLKNLFKSIPILGRFFTFLFRPSLPVIMLDLLTYINDRDDWNDCLAMANKDRIDELLARMRG